MIERVLLTSHIAGFVLLLLDPFCEFLWLRRQGTARESARSTRVLWVFNRIAPYGYVLLVISGGFMVARGWDLTSPWILGGFIGYAVVAVVPVLLVRPRGERAERRKAYVGLAGRFGALMFITYAMVLKPSWTVLAWAVAAFAVGSALLATAATGPRPGRRLAARVVFLAAAVVAVSLWRWQASILPPSFAPAGHSGHAGMAGMRSVTDLTQPPTDAPVVQVALTAEVKRVEIGGIGKDAWTYNGTVPGPALRVAVGQRLRVTLTNRLPEPTTIHWHGVLVPNAADGVAGVTQDAVPPGGQGVYDFVATHPGTYWYHSHNNPSAQIERGLFGTLVVTPAAGADGAVPADQDHVITLHTWGGAQAFNDSTRPEPIAATPGRPVRLRLVNTGSTRERLSISGAPFTVAAFDSGPVHGAQPLGASHVDVAGSGRVDLLTTLAAGQELDVRAGGTTLRVVTPGSRLAVPPDKDFRLLDAMAYGSAAGTAPLPQPDRSWNLRIDESMGFFDGRLTPLYRINGTLFPNGEMLMVEQGKTYDLTFDNRSDDDHPMHLHGHLFQVMAVNGKAGTGSPLIVDNVNVGPHDKVTIRFTADNPGIWMAHCHNLPHAAAGMDLMVGYEGITSPFRAGRDTVNKPE
ncbi:multicopper oxidase domain-containing protein [Couchioplanes caeruleus]|uniref:multicopper oxidase domain-containing protein n=1 Tax=Couchioplanes caeruleus TaxID=56438 RepID=UPI00201B9D6E|nr:multicopper oxidase domain-containing protein [Couchioplanes caeruleus]UQU67675.1 multicopper oxidase domain-containing protein [Couchioplanes caeruleus]